MLIAGSDATASEKDDAALMIDLACLLITGFTQPSHAAPGSGLYILKDALALEFPDRTKVWIGVRTWDNAKQIRQDAREVIRLRARRIAYLSYSYGSYGSEQFCNALQKAGESAHLAGYIDPVLYKPFFGRMYEAFAPGSTYTLPENVVRALLWRTVNRPPIVPGLTWPAPYGRDIHDVRVACKTIFCAPPAPEDYDVTMHIPAPDVMHATIDNNPIIHAHFIAELKRLVLT